MTNAPRSKRSPSPITRSNWRSKCSIAETVPHGFEVIFGKYHLISAPVTHGWTENPLVVSTHFGTREFAEQTLAMANPPGRHCLAVVGG